MDFNEKELSKIISLDLNVASALHRSEVLAYYSYLFQEEVCGSCQNKFKKYFNALKSEGIKKLTQMEENNSNFRLRKDINYVSVEFGGKMFNNANITDELALEFLKNNPNRIEVFEVYPEDWEGQVKSFSKEATEGAEGEKTTAKRRASTKK